VDLEEARDEFWGRLDQIQDSLSPWEREYANTTPLTMTPASTDRCDLARGGISGSRLGAGPHRSGSSYDEVADHELVRTFPPGSASEFLATATLREAADIERARDIAGCGTGAVAP